MRIFPVFEKQQARISRAEAQEGLTLVETMVSLSILAILVLGLSATVLRCMRLDRLSQEYGIALNAAREQMERLKAETIDDLALKNGATFAVDGLREVTTGKNVGTITVSSNVEGDDRIREVTVEVVWMGAKGAPITYRLTSRLIQSMEIVH